MLRFASRFAWESKSRNEFLSLFTSFRCKPERIFIDFHRVFPRKRRLFIDFQRAGRGKQRFCYVSHRVSRGKASRATSFCRYLRRSVANQSGFSSIFIGFFHESVGFSLIFNAQGVGNNVFVTFRIAFRVGKQVAQRVSVAIYIVPLQTRADFHRFSSGFSTKASAFH